MCQNSAQCKPNHQVKSLLTSPSWSYLAVVATALGNTRLTATEPRTLPSTRTLLYIIGSAIYIGVFMFSPMQPRSMRLGNGQVRYHNNWYSSLAKESLPQFVENRFRLLTQHLLSWSRDLQPPSWNQTPPFFLRAVVVSFSHSRLCSARSIRQLFDHCNLFPSVWTPEITVDYHEKELEPNIKWTQVKATLLLAICQR